MPATLQDHVALVTGGAKRVGQAVALRLAQEGMHVAFTFNTSVTQAKQTLGQIQRLGRQGHAIQADLAQPDAADQIYEQFTRRFDRLDALINNAAVFTPTPLGTVTTDQLQHHMAVNAWAPLLLTQRFAPMLAARQQADRTASPGRVVNLLDAHVMRQPHKGYAAYNASKAALQEITLTAAIELAPRITVNAIAPGVVAWAESATPQQQERYLARVPLGRKGTVEEAAAAVVFLIRDAGYCTGQILQLDGGRLLV